MFKKSAKISTAHSKEANHLICKEPVNTTTAHSKEANHLICREPVNTITAHSKEANHLICREGVNTTTAHSKEDHLICKKSVFFLESVDYLCSIYIRISLKIHKSPGHREL